MIEPTSIRDVFESLRSTTHCPFAPSARISYGPEWDSTVDFGSNVNELARELAAFCKVSEGFHGYVFGVGSSEVRSLSKTAGLFAKLLEELSERDPEGRSSLEGIESLDWQFEFAGVRLFLNVFSPCYRASHSKYVELRQGLLVFAQPESAFDLCGVDPSRPDIKRGIRGRFAAAGQAYDGDLIDRRIESHLYVFPEHVGDPPVRFWLMADQSEWDNEHHDD